MSSNSSSALKVINYMILPSCIICTRLHLFLFDLFFSPFQIFAQSFFHLRLGVKRTTCANSMRIKASMTFLNSPSLKFDYFAELHWTEVFFFVFFTSVCTYFLKTYYNKRLVFASFLYFFKSDYIGALIRKFVVVSVCPLNNLSGVQVVVTE